MDKKLFSFIISSAIGIYCIWLNTNNVSAVIGISVCMMASYLIYMGSLPKDTNLLSYFMN